MKIKAEYITNLKKRFLEAEAEQDFKLNFLVERGLINVNRIAVLTGEKNGN